MNKPIVLGLFLISFGIKAHSLELSEFQSQPNAPIAPHLISKAISLNQMDEDSCLSQHFESKIKGNLRAIFSVEDECDGGNSSGIVVDISTGKITHIIVDSEIEVVK